MRLELDSSILERWLTILSTNEGAPIVQDEIEQLLGPAISFETSQKRFRLFNTKTQVPVEVQGFTNVLKEIGGLESIGDACITSLYRLAPGQQFSYFDFTIRRLK